jgi:4-diphosphocytidyl-2-C-methyl-D-erythritol kinase
MLIQQRAATVRVWAPAKVNLFLEVLRRRPDGYHDLATLMLAVGLYDTLDIAPGAPDTGDVQLTCDIPGLSVGPENLVCRAVELIRGRFGIASGVRVHLRKRIPMAAGLGGGSSDAAGTLAGLNRLWRLGLSTAELSALGAELGSDVSFFFHGPAGWCTGRGEIVEPVAVGRPLSLVLACPSVGLSTAAVFRALQVPADPLPGVGVCQALRAGDIERIASGLHNRLESSALALCPAVERLRTQLASLGPPGVLMSGSGTTVFALCSSPSEATRLARAMLPVQDDRDLARVCVVRSCD